MAEKSKSMTRTCVSLPGHYLPELQGSISSIMLSHDNQYSEGLSIGQRSYDRQQLYREPAYPAELAFKCFAITPVQKGPHYS